MICHELGIVYHFNGGISVKKPSRNDFRLPAESALIHYFGLRSVLASQKATSGELTRNCSTNSGVFFCCHGDGVSIIGCCFLFIILVTHEVDMYRYIGLTRCFHFQHISINLSILISRLVWYNYRTM